MVDEMNVTAEKPKQMEVAGTGDEIGKLAKKLAAAVQASHSVPKDGKNTFHNYKYATAEDVKREARRALADAGLVALMHVESEEMRITEVVKQVNNKTEKKEAFQVSMRLRCTVFDSETGAYLSFVVTGDGQDSGDKARYKAFTGCSKYALINLLCLPTGDDPEEESNEPAAAKPAAARASRNVNPPPAASAEPPRVITAAEHALLIAEIDRTQTDVHGILTWCKVECLEEMTLDYYEAAMKRMAGKADAPAAQS